MTQPGVAGPQSTPACCCLLLLAANEREEFGTRVLLTYLERMHVISKFWARHFLHASAPRLAFLASTDKAVRRPGMFVA